MHLKRRKAYLQIFKITFEPNLELLFESEPYHANQTVILILSTLHLEGVYVFCSHYLYFENRKSTINAFILKPDTPSPCSVH